MSNITVSEMLRTTGANTSEFMNKVADHIEELAAHIEKLERRILDLENGKEE